MGWESGGWTRFFEKIGKLQVDYAAGVDALKRCTYTSQCFLSIIRRIGIFPIMGENSTGSSILRTPCHLNLPLVFPSIKFRSKDGSNNE